MVKWQISKQELRQKVKEYLLSHQGEEKGLYEWLDNVNSTLPPCRHYVRPQFTHLITMFRKQGSLEVIHTPSSGMYSFNTVQ